MNHGIFPMICYALNRLPARQAEPSPRPGRRIILGSGVGMASGSGEHTQPLPAAKLTFESSEVMFSQAVSAMSRLLVPAPPFILRDQRCWTKYEVVPPGKYTVSVQVNTPPLLLPFLTPQPICPAGSQLPKLLSQCAFKDNQATLQSK
jgi:hypothetical protein